MEQQMVIKEVKPMTSGGRAPRGQITYAAIGALVLFVIVLAMAVIRPGQPSREGEAVSPAAAPVTGQSQGEG